VLIQNAKKILKHKPIIKNIAQKNAVELQLIKELCKDIMKTKQDFLVLKDIALVENF
jgi:hypothetical protein